jgi:5-methylcytosine-specific restriction endonuclease McrA
MYKQILEKHGSERKAARALGLSRTRFTYLLKEELGLCRVSSCDKPPLEGRTRCEEHMRQASGNPETRKRYNRRYKQENRGKLREYGKNYYHKNRTRMREYYNNYYRSEEQRAKARFRAHKRRMRTTGFEPLTQEQFCSLMDQFEGRCFVCGSPDKLEVDHIQPVSLSGDNGFGNLAILCKSCNSAKRDKPPEEFYPGSRLLGLRSIKDGLRLRRTYTQLELTRELRGITRSPGRLEDRGHRNRITTHFQPHFYARENELWRSPRIQRKLVANRVRYLGKDPTEKEILRGFKVSGIHKGFSHHSPLWIKYFVEKYRPGTIYDPCGGWGHRFLGTLGTGVRYLYNDCDERSLEGIRSMCAGLGLGEPTLYCEDAVGFTPGETYDSVFTCPPYHNVERYNSRISGTYEELPLEEWLDVFWLGVLRSAVLGKPGVRYLGYVVNSGLKDYLGKVCEGQGFRKLEESRVGVNYRSHLNRTSDEGEWLVVWGIEL